MLVIYYFLIKLKSLFFKFNDLEFSFLYGFFLLLQDSQIAEAIEQLCHLWLVLKAKVLSEKLDVVFVRIWVIDQDGFGELVKGKTGVLDLLNLSRFLGNFDKLDREKGT